MMKTVGAESLGDFFRRLISGCFVATQLGFKELMMGRRIFICPATTLASGVRKSLRCFVLNGREGL
jgi:hypothetical protein